VIERAARAVGANRPSRRSGRGQHHERQLNTDQGVKITLSEGGVLTRGIPREKRVFPRDHGHGGQECRHQERTRCIMLPTTRADNPLMSEDRPYPDAHTLPLPWLHSLWGFSSRRLTRDQLSYSL
jgi:hypothetical protein